MEGTVKNEPYASHFLHISTQDEVYVSFTPSEEYGRFDRQLKVTPMRYFKKYCPFTSSSVKDEWMKKWIVTSNIKLFYTLKPVTKFAMSMKVGRGLVCHTTNHVFGANDSPLLIRSKDMLEEIWLLLISEEVLMDFHIRSLPRE